MQGKVAGQGDSQSWQPREAVQHLLQSEGYQLDTGPASQLLFLPTGLPELLGTTVDLEFQLEIVARDLAASLNLNRHAPAS